MFFAGDWVRQPAGRPQGLSQEKAYVTGLQVNRGVGEGGGERVHQPATRA